MMFGGRGMGRSGGGVSRSVSRAVTKVGGGVYGSNNSGKTVSHDPFPNSTVSSSVTRKAKCSNPLSLSSSSSHSVSHLSGVPIWRSFPDTDDCDWVSVDAFDVDGFYVRSVSGPVPSENEVDDALYSLQQVFVPTSRAQLVRDIYDNKSDDEVGRVTYPGILDQVSSDGSETDWTEPSLIPNNSKMLQANGSDRVYYAIHLLQTDPSVQRMVRSISFDIAVWDAIMNNEVVRELRESITVDEEHAVQSEDETTNSDSLNTTNAVMWIFDTAKAKFIEAIEKITKILNELFQIADQNTGEDAGAGSDPFNDKLRTSFMLSIMVLLIVVVTRAHS